MGLDFPIGAIYSDMQEPPELISCDGQELRIVDYPDLAGFFESNYGKSNVYGGDGINTFAMPKDPDLYMSIKPNVQFQNDVKAFVRSKGGVI